MEFAKENIKVSIVQSDIFISSKSITLHIHLMLLKLSCKPNKCKESFLYCYFGLRLFHKELYFPLLSLLKYNIS